MLSMVCRPARVKTEYFVVFNLGPRAAMSDGLNYGKAKNGKKVKRRARRERVLRPEMEVRLVIGIFHLK
jgi:hypothetical protein